MEVHVRCAQCKQAFLRPDYRIDESLKRHWKPYCSSKCQYESRFRGINLRCSNPTCQNTFYRRTSEMRNVVRSYCSRRCAVIMNNSLAPKRVRQVHVCAAASCTRQISKGALYCSKKCYAAARTVYLPNELIGILGTAARKLKRTPSKREVGAVADMVIRAFGSWNKALKIAGLTPHRSHSQRMYKRTNAIAFDGHKCDSISEAIIDNWLTKHKIFHTRDVPYPKTKHRADWGIGNKIFVEYFGLADDSPRYDRSIREKRSLCKQHGITLVEIYPKDLYPTANIGSKFPKAFTRQQLI